MKMTSSHCITEMWHRLAAVIFLLSWDILAAELSPLDDYILHHEALNYDTNNLHAHHLRSDHSTNPIITLSFPAFKRTFNLNLKPDNSVFKNNHELDLGGLKTFGTPKLAYTGHVDGSPNSYVTGTIVNGIFRGEIHSPDTPTLYIEPSSRFLGGRLPYHSVIYSAEHLDVDPYRHLRENETHPMSSCAHHHHHGPEFQREEGEPAVSERLHRYRRAVVDGMLDGTAAKPNTCYLELQADPFLWKYMTDPQANGGLGLPKEQAKDEIMSLFVSHVSSLNEIFTTTKFNTKDDSMYYRGITFIVQRSHVMTWESENCGTAQAGEFCRDNYDVNALLYQSSLSDHSTFCLSYLFTYRDFQRGTLGLAWVGKPSAGLTGGICEPYRESTEANNKRVRKSLNTGVVSLLNYGKRVAVRISQLTFAHEVGHNFGAEHDTGNECAPYGTNAPNAAQGNFIMYSSANPGNLDNNNKFSPCSRDYIAQVLHVVVNNLEGKRNCFNQSGIAYCGNGLVEDGEECDCGFTSDCDDNYCCIPRTEGMNDGCKRNGTNGLKVQCSPSEGPCCLTTCGFVQESVKMECSPNQECSNASFCNGNSAKCPNPVLVANNEFCDENKHVCETGQCIGSICARINWEECFLDGDWKTQNEDMCYVSCKDPISGDCVSSKNTEIVKKFPDFTKLLEEVGQGTLKPVQLNQGSPCKNFQGYCDSRFKCRQIDSDGAFKRLLNFFDTASLEEVRVWMTTNWWAVMLIWIGLVLLMAGFIKLCSYSTPTENPNRKPRRQQKEIREVNPLQDAQPLHENPVPRSNRSNPPATNDTGLYQAQNYKSDNHNRGAPSYGSASHTSNNDRDYDPNYDQNYPPPRYTDDMAPPRYDPYRPDFQKGYRRY